MSSNKPKINELTASAAGIRLLKELKEIILESDENINREEFIKEIDKRIDQLNTIGTIEHIQVIQ